MLHYALTTLQRPMALHAWLEGLVEIIMVGYQPIPPWPAFCGFVSLVILALNSVRSARQRLLEPEQGYRRV